MNPVTMSHNTRARASNDEISLLIIHRVYKLLIHDGITVYRYNPRLASPLSRVFARKIFGTEQIRPELFSRNVRQFLRVECGALVG